ncbi:hypothetical protein JTB14_034256 [Gonioctena quinquepunctata]|nr:hypothetical protein JTB14_034256 [Gonioctena quinquepunctata]
MTRKRKSLSLKEKNQIIEESEKTGLSTRKLAEKFDVGKTQVTMLLQHKAEVRNLYQEGGNEEQNRKLPKTEGRALDQIVFNWFCEARNKHLPISGPIIQAKALESAQVLGLDNFKASNGWLKRFRHRHDITFKKICGESADVNVCSTVSIEEEMERIDAEKLINAVHSHPAIWDMRTEDYADRMTKKEAWDEITNLFAPENTSEENKKNLGTLLQKKWKNIRDRYSREVSDKRGKWSHSKSRPNTTTNSEYTAGETMAQMSTECKIEEEETMFFEASESKIVQCSENNGEKDDDDRLFLLSLLPIMKSIPPNLKLDARIEMMQCIQKFVNNH